MVGGRACGEERSPRLGRLAWISLLEVDKVVGQGLGDRRTAGQASGEPREPGLGQEFAGGQDDDVLEPPTACLGHGVEGPQGFEVVAEQVEAEGLCRSRGPDVDDPAPVGELPHPAHLDHRLIAARHERDKQLPLRDSFADAQLQACGAQLVRGDGPLHHGQQRGHDHEVPRTAAELGEDLQPLRRLLVLGQRAFQRKGRAFGKDHDLPRDLPGSEVVGEAVRLLVVAHDDHQRGPRRHHTPTGGQVRGPGRRRHAE